jgi:Tfp pilus assembly protein PilX
MTRTTPFFLKRRQHGGAALIAIITMIVMLILGLAGATLAMNARLLSSHRAKQSAVRALADAGIDYGYWQYIWNRSALPYSETNRSLGEGTFSVQVTNNSAAVADSIKVVATARLRGSPQHGFSAVTSNPTLTASILPPPS